MKRSAYAVLFVDISTMPATVKGAAIFSEPSPTVDQSNLRLITLFKIEADTYQEARDLASSALASHAYNWIGEAESSPSRGVTRRARPVM